MPELRLSALLGCVHTCRMGRQSYSQERVQAWWTPYYYLGDANRRVRAQ